MLSLLRTQMNEECVDILGISTKHFLFRLCSFNNGIILLAVKYVRRWQWLPEEPAMSPQEWQLSVLNSQRENERIPPRNSFQNSLLGTAIREGIVTWGTHFPVSWELKATLACSVCFCLTPPRTMDVGSSFVVWNAHRFYHDTIWSVRYLSLC